MAENTEKDERLNELARQLKAIRPDVTYLAGTLLGTPEGWTLSFQSRFAGWPEGGGPDKGVELREAAPIYPDRMVSLWDSLGQPWIVVSTRAHLALFFRIGGNALMADELAIRYLAPWVDRREVVHQGGMGFIDYDPDSRAVTQHRPTPKQRMRVLERDGYRCQLCGERPSDNEHITLHVHHIKPFGRGGLTSDDNLITLCHTCHDGLDPHERPALFFLPGGHVAKALRREDATTFREGMRNYQRIAGSVIADLDRQD